jgi:hypothetical protein
MPLAEEVPWIRRNPAIAQTNIRCELNVQESLAQAISQRIIAVHLRSNCSLGLVARMRAAFPICTIHSFQQVLLWSSKHFAE